MNTDKAARNREIMGHLASQLVVNHLRVDLEGKEWMRVLREGFELPGVSRTIAVVGAGASRAAKLPLASEAIEILRRKLHIPVAEYLEEIERLEFKYGLAQAEFETALLAFSLIVRPERVRNALQELYALRYQPLLVYEILAHMLNHRFLDAIINFNFDELLDRSIADELTPPEYHYIVHDGDCPETTGDPARPYELPVYLKPHGTISHRSSLRFTREAYYGIPREIRRVLQDLLTGMPVTLLVVGFSMQSLEFKKFLERSHDLIDIFYINIEQPERSFESKYVDDNHFISVDGTITTDLDNMMQQLWQKVSDIFRSPYYTPRGIERHKLVCQIFSNPGLSTERTQSYPAVVKNYLHDRTILELAMSIAKAKGLVNMSVVSQDRCGTYYDLYWEADPHNNTSLYEMCENLNLEEIGYAREAFRLRKANIRAEVERSGAEEPAQPGSFWIIGEEAFQEQVDRLFENVRRQLKLNIHNQQSMRECQELFSSTLMYLYRDKEIELRGKADPIYNKVFIRPRPVRTLTGLSYETEHILQRQPWDKLFVIAETGEWLLSPRMVELIGDKEDLKIYMIVADRSFESQLKEKFGIKSVEIRSLNWWDHNQHVTLTVHDRTAQSAIYFTRRLRSPLISPIWLSGEDANVALEVFIAYWLKANESSSWIGRSKLGSREFFDSQ